MDILLLLQPVQAMTLTQGVGDYDIDSDGRAVRSLDQTGQYMFGGIRISKKKFLKDKISSMEMPKRVEFRDEPLPKTMIGKLSRKDIVEEELAKKAG